ncbi:MAG: BTAD domain-containing putative transcriptional regulator [Caldilineaceae bacterium]
MLTIQVFGSFKITQDDEIVTALTRPRGKSLLAYLLLHQATPQERAHLAALFWPETSDHQARTNLRRELHQLRQALPFFDTYCQSDNHHIHWAPSAACMVDAVAFDQHLQTATQAADPALRQACYQAAIDLYQGDLLPGLYDEWVLAKREVLRQAFIQALEALTALLIAARDYATAITLTQRLLQHDPLYEAGYTQLMELYALQNDRARALHTYHTCATVLERELGVPPGEATATLYQRLLRTDTDAIQAHRVTAMALQLVGRKAEWQTLLTTWRRTSRGQAHLLLIEGEAGIGKTRLAEELLDWANRQAIPIARSRAYAAEGRLAYAPVIEWLRSDALRPNLALLTPVWRTEVARLLPELLTEFPGLRAPEPLTEKWQRQRLFEALARALTVDDRPKVLLMDDLQWCDQETLEWLRYLMHFASGAPLLVLGTVRTEEIEEHHALHALARALRTNDQLTTVALSPLSAAATTALAVQIHGQSLDNTTATRLFTASEGNPLFVVEMIHAGIGTDNASPLAPRPSLPATQLPPKVYAVIQHRLAQLSPSARALASLAATMGRAFTFDVLVAASVNGEDEVANGLDELWRRRVIREHSAHEYDFSHDRIREAAYAELSPIRRKLLHQRVAQALEAVYDNELDGVSGQLALHCEQAGLLEQAVHWYQRAGQVARQLFAHTEAMLYLKSGLALLDQLPEDDSHKALKLQLLLSLNDLIVYIDGLTSLQRVTILRRAQALATQLQDDECLYTVHVSLSFFYQVRGDLQTASKIAQEHLLLVEQRGDLIQRARAYLCLAVVRMSFGAFQAANHAFAQSRSLLDRCPTELRHTLLWQQRSSQIDRWWVNTLWLAGFPDQAQAAAQRILLLAPELTPVDRSNIPFFAAILYRNLRLHQALLQQAELLNRTGKEYSMWLSEQDSMVFHGWLLAQQGDLNAGIALTQRGVEGFRRVGQTMFLTHRLAMLAEMQLLAHQFSAAQMTLDEAFSISQEKGEHFWDVDLYRLQGDRWLAHSASDAQAEQSYLQAIAIAQQQGAKSLELRATTALCRLWQQQGRTAQAHQRLAQIYNWFTEGFDTHDLQAAQKLLEQLRLTAI